MKTILFQGDSITDTGRSTGTIVETGWGYTTFIAARLGTRWPGKYKVLNRGVNGNRITDLFSRMKADIINLAPDVITILIGANDVWHELRTKTGTTTYVFEEIYDLMIKEIRKAITETRIILMEPFALEGTVTRPYWPQFYSDIREKSDAVKRVSNKNGVELVLLQNSFDKAAEQSNPELWLVDGIHPSPAGHELITNEWLRCYFGDEQ